MAGEQDIQEKASDNQADATSKREVSTIAFPYGDLDDAVEVAKAVHAVGGQSCTLDQLAAHLKQSAQSGSFRLRLSFPRIFGLTVADRGSLVLTDLGRRIVDPTQEKRARVEAFLSVPLYKEVYEKYKGFTLPPAAALEREMANLGVSAKQTDKARQVFDRSAQQAGFYSFGKDRLVMPPLGAQPEGGAREEVQEEKKPGNGGGGGGGGGGGDDTGLDPLIQGLLRRLPKPGDAWDMDKRARWLQTLAANLDIVYEADGDSPKYIAVEVKTL